MCILQWSEVHTPFTPYPFASADSTATNCLAEQRLSGTLKQPTMAAFHAHKRFVRGQLATKWLALAVDADTGTALSADCA